MPSSHLSMCVSTHEQSSTASVAQSKGKVDEQQSMSDLLPKDIEITPGYDMKGFDNMFFFLAEYQAEEKTRLNQAGL